MKRYSMKLFIKLILPAAAFLLCWSANATDLQLFPPENKALPEPCGNGQSWETGKSGPELTITAEQISENPAGYIKKINLMPLAGKTVKISAEIKAENVSAPAKPYHGVKFMIHYRCRSGVQSWPAGADGEYGNFDWRGHQFFFNVPEDTEEAELVLGLQGVTGKVSFRKVTAEAVELFPPVWQMPENFKCEYDSRITGDIRRRGFMTPATSNITEQDLRDMAAWGANLIRWQIGNMRKNIINPEEFQMFFDAEIERLDRFLPLCEELGLKVVVDMHTLPGGRYGDDLVLGTAGISDDNKSLFRMFNEKESLDTFIKVWEKTARHYRGNKNIWAYDLCNEPAQKSPVGNDYLKVQYLAAEAIRKIDPDTPILVESNQWDNPLHFAYLQPLPFKNVIYEVHMYDPGCYTHQGVYADLPVGVPYPGMHYGEYYDRERLRITLNPVRKFEQKYGAKIFVGEFSVIRWAPGAELYLDDVISLFEEYNWDWTYHAFREWDGWSAEHGADKNNQQPETTDTPRKKTLLRYLKLNRTQAE